MECCSTSVVVKQFVSFCLMKFLPFKKEEEDIFDIKWGIIKKKGDFKRILQGPQ